MANQKKLFTILKIRTGVDGIGTVILRYEAFDVTILVGKIATSSYEVEITAQKTLIIDHVSHLETARKVDHQTLEEQEVHLEKQRENSMFYEAEALAKMIETKDDLKTKNVIKNYLTLHALFLVY